MAKKTRGQLQAEIDLEARLKKQKDDCDDSYAPIIVKTIVYGICGLFTAAIIAGIVDLLVRKFL